MKRTLSIDEVLNQASGYVSGESVPQDYEQAVFLLSQIAVDSCDAKDLLEKLTAKGLGIECSIASSIDENVAPVADLDRWEVRPKNLEPDEARCVNCGAAGALSAMEDQALICDKGRGGCGAVQDIAISENGLTKGLAIEPYSSAPGIRSYLGSQISALKYDSTINADAYSRIIEEVVKRIKECAILNRLVPEAVQRNLVIVPVPSSKRRKKQPVYELARAIAGDEFTYAQVLTKRTQIESKNRPAGSELAEGEVTCRSGFIADNVLMIDDTYGEGATARACINALRRNGVKNIYLLTLCKNIFGGLKS